MPHRYLGGEYRRKPLLWLSVAANVYAVVVGWHRARLTSRPLSG